MIQYLTRNQLNKEKYDHCISNAVNTRIYGYSWYLDIVCDDWDVLVKDDYVAVMPLPKRKKYGIHYIYLPPWTQQLGVFSMIDFSESLVPRFINSIPKKYKFIEIFLNSANVSDIKQIKPRDNFTLELAGPYKTIRKEYRKGRKSSIKQAQNSDLTIVDNFNHDDIIQLFKQNKGVALDKDKLNYDVLSKLIKHALFLNFAESYAVVNNSNALIGGAFVLIDGHRITYLFSAINNEGRTKQAMSFLLDSIIRKNSESESVLDFEGSTIKELASFFKSFGAIKETYFHLKKYKL